MCVLEITAAEAIKELFHKVKCLFDFHAHAKDLASFTREYKSGAKPPVLLVSATVYGLRFTKDQVGQMLSDASLYLQHTSDRRPGVSIYDNPHFLPLEDVTKNPVGDVAVDGMVARVQNEGLDVDFLLDALDHRDELNERASNQLIKSELKRYSIWLKI